MTGSEDPTIESCDSLAVALLAEYRRGFLQYSIFLARMDMIFDMRIPLMRIRDLQASVNDPAYTEVVA